MGKPWQQLLTVTGKIWSAGSGQKSDSLLYQSHCANSFSKSTKAVLDVLDSSVDQTLGVL
jgi:hypothetical protein